MERVKRLVITPNPSQVSEVTKRDDDEIVNNKKMVYSLRLTDVKKAICCVKTLHSQIFDNYQVGRTCWQNVYTRYAQFLTKN